MPIEFPTKISRKNVDGGNIDPFNLLLWGEYKIDFDGLSVFRWWAPEKKKRGYYIYTRGEQICFFGEANFF